MTEPTLKLNQLTLEERCDVEQAIAKFELAWHQSPSPDPLGFLPSSRKLRSITLDELLRIDAEFKSIGPSKKAAELTHASPASGEKLEYLNCKTPIFSDLGNISAVSVYSHVQPHAQGGLGEIFVADDQQLLRRVVIKCLKKRWGNNRRAVRSFLREAQIASRLEHPGIVPIHARGTTKDGRPWYSMRYVEGKTLGQSIDELHLEWDDAKRRTAGLRALLTSFVAACKTVAYAHSRGVLHRDLKPDNIMLAPFGETLVMDWGMAKLLGDHDAVCDGLSDDTNFNASPDKWPESSPDKATTDGVASDNSDTTTVGNDDPQELHSEEYSGTAVGSLVGTPAYMSPEQACGDVSAICMRTDVFGLGTILYAILCNRAPFHSDSVAESVRKVSHDDCQPPVAYKDQVPLGLNAICCRAMANRPEDRYVSPLQLATDVENWLVDEPILAMRESVWDRTRRKCRHHRSAVAVLAAIGFVLPLAMVTGSWLLAQQRLRTELAERTAEIRGQSAKELTDFLTQTFHSADPISFEDPGFMGPNSQSSDATMRRMLDASRELLTNCVSDQPELRSQLLVSIGNAHRSLADYDKATAALTESHQVRLKEFGANAAETLECKYHLARVSHDRGDYQIAENQYREIIAELERIVPSVPLKVADVKFQLAWLLFWQPLGFDLPQFNRESVKESVQLFSDVIETRQRWLPPTDRSIGLALVGIAGAQACLPEEKIAAAINTSMALEIFRDSKQERTMGNFLIEYQKAERLRQQHQFERADELYLKLLDQSLRVFGKNHPVVIIHQWNMVGMYRKIGSLKRAEEVISNIREALKQSVAIRSSPVIVDFLMQYADALRNVNTARSREVYAETIGYANERADTNRQVIVLMQQNLDALNSTE